MFRWNYFGKKYERIWFRRVLEKPSGTKYQRQPLTLKNWSTYLNLVQKTRYQRYRSIWHFHKCTVQKCQLTYALLVVWHKRFHHGCSPNIVHAFIELESRFCWDQKSDIFICTCQKPRRIFYSQICKFIIL